MGLVSVYWTYWYIDSFNCKYLRSSTALQFGISVIGVLVFAGLTAYDTQRIKAMYFDGSGQEGKKAIMGACLSGCITSCILIQLFGQRR